MADTLNRIFQDSIRKFALNPALSSKIAGEYKTITYQEMGAKVRAFASGLITLGVKRGDRIALLSENRPEWAIADIGIIYIGAVNVAIFPTLPPGQVRYIVNDSGAKIILVSDKSQLSKALEVKKELPDLQIITMDCPADASNSVITFDEMTRRGEASKLSDDEYNKLWQSAQPNDWASIIYTSGTTGDPKGAILSHHNFTSNVAATQEVIPLESGDVMLSIVPLNHVMGRLADHYLPISCGATVAYIENLRRLKQNMTEIRPHYVVLVPRFFEMFQDGLLTSIAKEPFLKQKLFHWALSVGKRYFESVQEKQNISGFLVFQRWLADKLVFTKIRERLGLERLKFFISGSAPLSDSNAEFFSALGFEILEGYGLTETSPLIAVNRPHQTRFGTVGPPVTGVEVKIAGDGEIIVRGPNVMQGYYNKPAETAEAINAEGWFHTGDIGEFDEKGFLKITDRKKNLIVLANGKKVAPQPMENRLKESQYISQIILLGDKQNSITTLIVPAFEHVKKWLMDKGIGIGSEDNSELIRHADVNRLIRGEIQHLSNEFADYEKVRRFTLMDHEFTIESGEMTPTLKVKRRVVMKRYRDLIDTMYR
jgi:long-chain acyl-CoA synthetase